MTIKYYAERINGKIRYFKENIDRFGQLIARIEIEQWRYEWATKKS